MRVKNIIIFVVVFIVILSFSFAYPYGPNSITPQPGERANFSVTAKTVYAQAGNVTELTIDARTITRRWQGYYGNVTGEITLDDAQGNTFFDWSGSGSPDGQIYAANQTVDDWSDVICVNLTGNGTVGVTGINVTLIEGMYGMTAGSSEGIDETFNTTHNIEVGIDTHLGCPGTNTYVDNSSQSTYFNETLLTENNTGAVIYGTIITQNTGGFDGRTHDFQMIVGDNGDDSFTTEYWFYVELN